MLDFFPQYQSNYRSLKDSQKNELKSNLLTKDYIKRNMRIKKLHKILGNYYNSLYLLSI